MPDTPTEFKNLWCEKFPLLYDTKYMLSVSNTMFNEIGINTNLQDSYDLLVKYKEEIPLINIEKEFNRYEVKKTDECFFSHEAGFDSFMTGYVFFKMLALQSKIRIG